MKEDLVKRGCSFQGLSWGVVCESKLPNGSNKSLILKLIFEDSRREADLTDCMEYHQTTIPHLVSNWRIALKNAKTANRHIRFPLAMWHYGKVQKKKKKTPHCNAIKIH